MSVSWSKPNDFTHCSRCGKSDCMNRSPRKTAGCAFAQKSDKLTTEQLIKNQLGS